MKITHMDGNKRKFVSTGDLTDGKKQRFSAENASPSYLNGQRHRLPIYYGKQSLLNEIMRNETTILMSETGSGKTTQLPQYLLETTLAKQGVICCTQPRRIAAITTANWVSKECGTTVGDLIGFTIRFEDVTSSQTKIRYMTDGMLLREALLDSLLLKYSVIILDEAHERSVTTDVLFGVVKMAQVKRKGTKPLKVVIMSATLNAVEFEKYFANSKVCFIEGRRHPIKIRYTEEIQKDYLHSSIVSAFQLHQEAPLGHDILVFLTGQEEIESAAKVLHDIYQQMQKTVAKLCICTLFASLPNSEQLKVFRKTEPGHRKIILATNIAETSVTIPGVKYVIDCGMVKAKAYNALSGLDILKVHPISKAQARQRSGRAGRECPGICYRLFQEQAFLTLEENTVPEIQRCNILSVLLQLLILGLKDVHEFDFLSPPSGGAVNEALNQLFLLGAIASKESQVLTGKGKKLSAFPLDPSLACCILSAHEHGCIEEVITIVALLSVDSIIYSPPHLREKSKKAYEKFKSCEGDHVSLLLFYRAYKQAKGNINWCRDHFVNTRNIKTVIQIRAQLRELCLRQNIPLSSCGSNFSSIRKAICSGKFLNSAELQKSGIYLTMVQKQEVHIHPSSVLFNMKPSFVIFTEVVETSRRYMRHLSVVDPEWLIEASPRLFDKKRLIPNPFLS